MKIINSYFEDILVRIYICIYSSMCNTYLICTYVLNICY